MLHDIGAQAVVYQVLDEVLAGTGVPAGARGAMFGVVDDLRAGSAPADEVRRAEQISIGIHRLEWALCRHDDRSAEAAREELKAPASEWINSRICSRH